jgi:hypothetical protein
MKKPPPHYLLVGTLAAVAAALGVTVLAGGGGALPAAPHVPAAVVAATQIKSAVAAPLPPSTAAHRVRATVLIVRAAPRQRPTARRTFRRHVRLTVVRPTAPVVPAAPTRPIAASPVLAKPSLWKHGKQRGRSAARAKGRPAAKGRLTDKQSHEKTKPSGKKGGDNGHHGRGDGGHGGEGHKGGK